MNRQLALGITPRVEASLENFTPGDNAETLAHLSTCAQGHGEPFLYLWGGNGTGKSHLLQAACQLAGGEGRNSVFIPLEQAALFTPEILEGLDSLALVCIDDLHRIGGQRAWEEALFHLFNRLRASGCPLIVSARHAPSTLPVTLPDLGSRLGWGLTLRLRELNDEQKTRALIDSAARRGLTMSAEAAGYILRHCPREMGALQHLLDALDRASLEAQRRLTIPFIKSCLEHPD
ncbi:MAG: DnaA regulatory inactivator Hda [Candidatus Sedimenticola endophacoides]